tara:strand:+ start:626 stop:1141 length:516 start_codon:yes stop_codon:yes gene_type:complete
MALNLNLSDFKEAVGMGTRPNRYEVTMKIPNSSYEMKAEVSALSLPDSNVPPIGVPFRGRVLKLPGDRRYATWGFTVYDTIQKGNIWKELHDWSERINEHFTNKTPFVYEEDTQNWSIAHYDLNGQSKIKEIILHNCWPSNVGSFDLAYGAMDTLAQFTCQVEYEYFTVQS